MSDSDLQVILMDMYYCYRDYSPGEVCCEPYDLRRWANVIWDVLQQRKCQSLILSPANWLDPGERPEEDN